ncbi:helix-turn-helix transcriptional regulator [Vineibacter terrae]|uniref:Helix-turn-helix transcriptional regulator n=1 Tax=Vineibacter terrae TaxID=2586908 RepID=A0A5C8PR71_9HYPH|nr:helix-turn-helix transcriptional regulator [Vineibacter terrae]TXL78698.1 helix-turn-helix transcriptional regulator [Vineibacter terrae]
MSSAATFAARLRWWRTHRGWSQLSLAHRAEVSQRHISFLELGRTQPSREMVLRLAAVLEVPLRQQNALLHAAGFAPMWRESGLAESALSIVDRALDHVLRQHEPYPALVVDRQWNVLRENRASRQLTSFLNGTPERAPDPAAPVNLADVLLGPHLLRPLIVNWLDVAHALVQIVHADALSDGSEETAALLARLLRYPDVPKLADIPRLEQPREPILTIEFRKDSIAFKLFTVIATLGTPQDITAQEIRIESFFPADSNTARLLEGWAAEG